MSKTDMLMKTRNFFRTFVILPTLVVPLTGLDLFASDIETCNMFLHRSAPLSFPAPTGNLHLPQKLNKFLLLQLSALAPLV